MYDFEFEIDCNDDTGKWSITFYDMKENELNQLLVMWMKVRDWLIEKEKK